MNALTRMTGTALSRRTLVKGFGVGAAGFTLAQAAFLRSVAAQSEDVQRILDITATVERFGVTFLGEGLQSAMEGNFDQEWPDEVVAIVTAARAQERFHLDAFEEAGGVPLVDTFTVPPEFLTDYAAFFGAVVEQETAETAAQIAAMRAFTELGRPDLVKVSFQYAAEESEHRLVANYALGVRPANDIAFAPNLFATVEEFLESLEQRGIIGGSGTEIVFPGPGEIDPSGVTRRRPGGVAVACAARAAGTPVASAATPAAGGAATRVEIDNLAFIPPAVTIAVGEAVEWTNNDSIAHTATAADEAFDSGILSEGQTFTHTFDTAGTFDYICTIHPFMRGTVTVQ